MAAALRTLSAARHVGKVLAAAPAPLPGKEGSAGTWLVTGGTGALGALAAAHLVTAGATHVQLSCRSRPARWEGIDAGSAACVTAVQMDVVACADGAGWLTCTPAAGLLHAAGAVSDALLPRQTLRGESGVGTVL